MLDCPDPPLITFAVMNNEPIEKAVPTSLKQSPAGQEWAGPSPGCSPEQGTFTAGCVESTLTAPRVLSEHGAHRLHFEFSSDRKKDTLSQ